ncbi:MAG: cytochrome c biogenesis protein CcsA, partial [Anaplasmataceae bacterium]|nr:cytochrome c biogenesis protein CcsA [Anaplasmataceae bacterium]
YYSSEDDKKIKEFTIVIQLLLFVLFQLFILFEANPFLLNNNYITSDLSPILQDKALFIHPPLLYIGYIGTSIIFSYSIAMLFCGNNRLHDKQMQNWYKGIWMMLTVGILLGSLWSYREIGWGGFWFWDPIENISLLPWLSLLILLHTKNNIIKISAGISTFLFAILGTFLNRSNIITSIHSFANNNSQILKYYIIGIFFCSIVVYLLKIKKFAMSNITRSSIFFVMNNIISLIGIIVLLLGFILPIIGKEQKIFIDNSYYNDSFFFLSIISMIAITIYNFSKIKYFHIFYLICSTLLILLLLHDINISLFLIYLISITVVTSIYRIVTNSTKLESSLSHIGFALMIFSIVFSGVNETEKYLAISVGNSVNFDGYNIELNNIKITQIDNYDNIETIFKVNHSITMNPAIKHYKQDDQYIAEPSIKNIMLFNDLYLVVDEITENGLVYLHVYHKRGINLLWLSVMLIAFASVIANFYKRIIKIF